MSILSFMPATATIPSNSSGRRFAGFGFPHLSSTSLRMAPFLDYKNTSLTVANCNRNPESYPTVELNAAVRLAEKHIPLVPHWKFCYMIIRKVFVYGAFLIHRLDPDLRDAVCILSLVCIAIDTIEDASMDSKVKVPILMAFHSHIYNHGWHFACGTKDFRVLMNKFHHVSTSFLELGSSYQKVIENVSMTMGAGMAKFLYKEVETIEDYDEYCHYVAGVIGIGFSKLIHASGIEDLPPDTFFHSMSVFFQKADIIQDYLEDTSEMSRMFWPREIWSKYVDDKFEDLKFEKNSIKAVHCLNEMITNALIHTDDCLQYISAVQHPTIFQSCAMAQIVTIGTLASCYNNIQVFRGVENMRFDLAPKAVDGSKTISDFYRVFYDFTCVLKSKIDDSDPNATKTKERVEATLNALQELRNLKVN